MRKKYTNKYIRWRSASDNSAVSTIAGMRAYSFTTRFVNFLANFVKFEDKF